MDEERGGAGSAQEGQAGGMGEKLEESYVRTEGAILLLYSTFVDWYYRIYHFLLLQSTAPPEIMTERMGVLKKMNYQSYTSLLSAILVRATTI